MSSLNTDRAAPELLATLVRQHWGVESLHWLRDTVYREDNSTVHTRSGPRVMAALRNLVIGLIRQAGHTRIAPTIRKIKNRPPLLLTILGLRPSPQNSS